MSGEALNLVIALLPELVLLAGGALLVVLLPRDWSGAGAGEGGGPSRSAARIALVTVSLAVVALQFGPQISAAVAPGGGDGGAGWGAIKLDATARAARWAALLVGILLIGGNYALPELPGSRPGPGRNDRAAPEFFMLLLFSLAGLMLTSLANDLIVLFLAIELTIVPTFVAIALSRPQAGATEAAGKYFFLGALSGAFLLMGLAYTFGLTGQTNLDLLGSAMEAGGGRAAGGPGLVALLAMGLVLGGLGFKLAAFPYHVYLADVYQGAAAPVAGWLSFVPKAAGLLAVGKLLVAIGGPFATRLTIDGPQTVGWLSQPVWTWTIGGLAVATMTTGNVLALWQRNVKRTLAYSSVAHSGYLLVGLLVVPEAPDHSVPVVVLFYLVGYGLANLGAFLVLSSIRRADRSEGASAGGTAEAQTFADLRGLARRQPALAVAMAVFAFSLMGLPLTVGFTAKLYIFLGAFRAGYGWLVGIALVNAAVGAAYYLRIIGACWKGGANGDGPPADAPAGHDQADSAEPFGAEPLTAEGLVEAARQRPPSLVIAVLAGATILFGLFPGGIYHRLTIDTPIQPRQHDVIESPGPDERLPLLDPGLTDSETGR